MKQRLSPLLLAWLLLQAQLLLQPVSACFSQSHLYQRRESSSRQRSSHAFAFGEYQPKASELTVHASGPEGVPVRHSRHLLKSNSDLLVFTSRRSRFMTRRCKEKLEQLALLVRNQWNGYIRIRVHHAWMPKQDAFWDRQVGHRGLESLHYSGRAVDLSLVTVKPGHQYRDANLGRLAQLAYYQAYFDYCKVLKDTVHCSVKSDDPMDSDWLACFPSEATVVKRNHGNKENGTIVSVGNLKVGDEVLTIDEQTGGRVYTRVLGYHHRLASSSAAYLSLQLADGFQLTVSPNHLLFSKNSSLQRAESVYAADLIQGQLLMTSSASGGRGGWTKILKITRQLRQGRFAPITSAGHLLVDGVWASSYAHTRHQAVAHALFAPLRWKHWLRAGVGIKTANDEDDYDDRGVHWYSNWLHVAAQLLAPSAALFPN